MGYNTIQTSESEAGLEKRQLDDLSKCIAEIATLDHTSAIPILADLVPGFKTSLSLTGERLVHHEAYQGNGSLNYLARIWMNMGGKCQRRDAPLRLRLQQYELCSEFERLYKDSEREIKDSSILGFFSGVREFSIVCGHCVGHPWICIPMGERMDDALYVSATIYKSIWGNQKSNGSISGGIEPGETTVWKRYKLASVEQMREAVARGIE